MDIERPNTIISHNSKLILAVLFTVKQKPTPRDALDKARRGKQHEARKLGLGRRLPRAGGGRSRRRKQRRSARPLVFSYRRCCARVGHHLRGGARAGEPLCARAVHGECMDRRTAWHLKLCILLGQQACLCVYADEKSARCIDGFRVHCRTRSSTSRRRKSTATVTLVRLLCAHIAVRHVITSSHACDCLPGAWDPKITTFPGLYLVATLYAHVAAMVGVAFCSPAVLRGVNVLFAMGSAFLLMKLRALIVVRAMAINYHSSDIPIRLRCAICHC